MPPLYSNRFKLLTKETTDFTFLPKQNRQKTQTVVNNQQERLRICPKLFKKLLFGKKLKIKSAKGQRDNIEVEILPLYEANPNRKIT